MQKALRNYTQESKSYQSDHSGSSYVSESSESAGNNDDVLNDLGLDNIESKNNTNNNLYFMNKTKISIINQITVITIITIYRSPSKRSSLNRKVKNSR